MKSSKKPKIIITCLKDKTMNKTIKVILLSWSGSQLIKSKWNKNKRKQRNKLIRNMKINPLRRFLISNFEYLKKLIMIGSLSLEGSRIYRRSKYVQKCKGNSLLKYLKKRHKSPKFQAKA